MEDRYVLRNKLKLARVERSLSQEQLAGLAGVSRQTISSIETGQYSPTARLGLVLSKCLDKPFEAIFYLEEV